MTGVQTCALPIFSEQSFDLDEKKELILDIPQVSDQVTIVGFQIVGYKNCCLYSGYYATEIAEEEKREVRLALATTTFKKEDFILPNIQLLKDEILNSEDEMQKISMCTSLTTEELSTKKNWNAIIYGFIQIQTQEDQEDFHAELSRQICRRNRQHTFF